MSYLANKLAAASRPRFAFDESYLRHWLPMTKTGLDAIQADVKYSHAANFDSESADKETTGLVFAGYEPWIADHPRYAADGAMSRHRAVRDTGSLAYEPLNVYTADPNEGIHIPPPERYETDAKGVTFAIWMKPTEHIADHDILFAQNGTANFLPYAATNDRVDGWGITIGEMGKIAVHWGDGGDFSYQTETYDTAADFAVGEWHRIVVSLYFPTPSRCYSKVWVDKKPQTMYSNYGYDVQRKTINPYQTPKACVNMAGTWADMMIWTLDMTQKEVNADYSYDFVSPFANYMNDMRHYSAVPMKEIDRTSGTAYVDPVFDLNWYTTERLRMLTATDVVIGLVEPTVAALPYMPITTGMTAHFYDNTSRSNMAVGGMWMFLRADASNAGSVTYLHEHSKAGQGNLRIRLNADGKIRMSLNDTIGYDGNRGFLELTSVSAVLPYDQDVLVAWYCNGSNWFFYIEGQGSIAMVETTNTITAGTGLTQAAWYTRFGTGTSGVIASPMMEAAIGGPNKTTGRLYGIGVSDRQWNTPWLDGLGTSIREGSVLYKPFNHNILS